MIFNSFGQFIIPSKLAFSLVAAFTLIALSGCGSINEERYDSPFPKYSDLLKASKQESSLKSGSPETISPEVNTVAEPLPVEPVISSSSVAKTNTNTGVVSKEIEVKELNQKIAMESFVAGVDKSNNEPAREGYAVGPGDVLEIAVFQVDDLNRKVRVTGDGFIMIPLLGGVQVEGKTTTDIENLLTRDLGENYLHDPQVSVFVDEFRSHQVAVLGAVKDPNIYSIRQPRTVLEMLAQAGGLTDTAGTKVQVRRTILDRDTNSKNKETLLIDLSALLSSGDALEDIVLQGGDSIVVPEAGSVFVEGAVSQPGAYDLRGETNVLKVLSMAGGITYETSKQKIEVYRENDYGENQVYQVDYEKIRINPASDLILEEGDIVVVHHSGIKRGLSNFWKGITGIFRVAL